jgi:hypothetical protein
MKVGQVYKAKNTNILFIPLSEPDLDGNMLQLIVDAGHTKSINNVSQSGFDRPDVTTTKKAIEVNHPFFAFQYNKLENVDNTYVPSNELALSIGDKYQYIGKPAEYTVLTFFDRLKTANAKSKIPYPFGVNLADVIAFVDGIINSKTGISPYLKSNGIITDDFYARLKSVLLGNNNVNAELAYWSISEPKLPKVLYLKQSKPKKAITIDLKQKVKRKNIEAGAIVTNSMIVANQTNQTNNFTTFDVDVRSGSLLLDKFRFTVDGIYESQDRLACSDSVLRLVCIQKMLDNGAVKISGQIEIAEIGGNAGNGIYGQSIVLNTKNFKKVEDVDRYIELTNISASGDRTPFKIDFVNTTNLSGYEYGMILNPAMMYLGGGKFTDVQNGSGKYGVGDEFSISDSDEITYGYAKDQNWTILYSKLCLNKNGEFEVLYTCIGMSFLRQAGDTYNFSNPYTNNEKMQIFQILESTLDEKFESGSYFDFKSYREDREKIANAYLQGSLQVTPKTVASSVDEYSDLKEILGEEFDDEFLSVVSGLDWAKIDKVRQKDPNALNAIKDLIQQIYVDYLLEKDFAVEPPASNNFDGIKTKGFWTGDADIIKNRLVLKYDVPFVSNTDGYSSNSPDFPSMSYDEFGDFFYNAVGGIDLPSALVITGDSGSCQLIISKGIEPAVNLKMNWRRFTSDSDVNLNAFTQDFGYDLTGGGMDNRKWGDIKNYPLKYYAAWVMYNIAVYGCEGAEGISVLFGGNITKAKKSLPFKVTPFWLSELRYFNSLGLFPTIEGVIEYICEIQGRTVEELAQGQGNREYFVKYRTYNADFMFYSASLSKTNPFEKFKNVSVGSDRDSYLFKNNAELFRANLEKVDVDWGHPNSTYEPIVITAPAVTKKSRKPATAKKPKLKFDMWKEYPKNIHDEMDAGFGIDPNTFRAFHTYFEYQGKRFVYTILATTSSVVQGEQFSKALQLITDSVDYNTMAASRQLMSEFRDDFLAQSAKISEQHPNFEQVFEFTAVLLPAGQDFVNELREGLANMKAAKTQPQVPTDFKSWRKSESYAISADALRDQLSVTYQTDGLDLYHTSFSYKNDKYIYFSLMYQTRLVGNTAQVNSSRYLAMYAVAQGYSRLSLSLINDYEQIFTDELTKGAASLNREFRTLGVVVPVSEEGKFIDGYYAYLQAQVAQPFVPPTPPTPPTPPQPKPEPVKPKPVPPQPKPEPVKPKPATKVDKLSKKYEDIDLDF